MSHDELAGKTAIVTGAGSGIGQSIAILFARKGAKVVVADISKRAGLETVEKIKTCGPSSSEAYFIETDVSKAESVNNLVRVTVERYGKLNTVINNAGIELVGTVLTLSEEEWDRVIDTNLKSVFLLSKSAMPELIRAGEGSTIVNIASIAGLVSYKGAIAYSASKAGVIALTKAMALDHASQGIRINCICPGGIDTPLHQKYLAQLPPGIREEYDQKQKMAHPLGRNGRPEEIAEAALFLASQRSTFMVGAALVVDGGFTIQ